MPADSLLKRFWQGLSTDEIVLAVLVLLSFIGIGVSDFSTRTGLWYWVFMVPVFGATCLFTQWSNARAGGQVWYKLIWTQVLHWGGLLLAIYLVYLLMSARGMDSANVGLVIVTMLALTTFLAGVYTGWLFCLAGVFLGIAALVATYIEANVWVLLLIAVLVLVIALVWDRYGAGHTHQPVQ
jgi:hypothetical protein